MEIARTGHRKHIQKGGYNKEFYVCSAVRAEQTRAAHLLLRMSPGHSRCASIASPAQRVQTCTALWRGGTKPLHMKSALEKISKAL